MTPAADLARRIEVSVADTVSDVTQTSDVTISMASNDQASRALWMDPNKGVFANMPKGSVGIEASTITNGWASELGQAAAAAKVDFLEAPMVGSRPQADAGTLFVLAGGDEIVLEKVRPVLESYSGAIQSVGPVGNAATMKLAINGLFGVQVAAYAEMVGMLQQSPIPTQLAFDTLTIR